MKKIKKIFLLIQDNTSTPKSALKGSHDLKNFEQQPLKLTSTPPSPPPPPPTSTHNHVIRGGVSPPPTPIITPTSNSFSSIPNQHPLLRQHPFTLPPPSLSPQNCATKDFQRGVADSLFMPPNTTFPPANVPRLDLPADENVDLEELEQFAKEFKQRRIKLGK